jgi:hypothetical protein
MNIYTYETLGGKDLIREYLDNLPKKNLQKDISLLNRWNEKVSHSYKM